jgi:hypothetical protein
VCDPSPQSFERLEAGMSKRNNEGDVLANKVNLFLVKQQKLLASITGGGSASTNAPKSETETEKDDFDSEEFGYDRIGVGGKIPKDVQDGSFTKKTNITNDKLLEQLMGKKRAKAHLASKAAQANQSQTKVFIGKPTQPAKPEESEDEEEGRAAAFKSKRKKPTGQPKPPQEEDKPEDSEKASGMETADANPDLNDETNPAAQLPTRRKVEDSDSDDAPRPKKAKKGSYLDEILAQKAAKKKKKNKGKGAS